MVYRNWFIGAKWDKVIISQYFFVVLTAPQPFNHYLI
jgi:hypothetical protein